MKDIWNSLLAYVALLYQELGWRLLEAMLLLIFSGITEGAGLMLLVPFLNTAATGTNTSNNVQPAFPSLVSLFNAAHLPLSLTSLLLIGLLLVILRTMLTWRREVFMARLRLDFMDHLKVSLFLSAESARWEHWMRQRSSGFQHILTSEVPAVGEGTFYFLHLGVTIVLALVYLVVAMRLSFLLTAGAVLATIVFFWPLRAYLNRSYLLGQTIERTGNSLYEHICHFFNGLKFTKSHGEASRFTSILTATLERLHSQRMTYVGSCEKVRVSLEISGAIVLTGFIYIAVTRLHMTAAEIILLIIIYSRLMPMASRIFLQTQHVLHMLPAFRSVVDALQACKNAAEPPGEAVSDCPRFYEEIRFYDVSIRYDADGKFALAGINCTIPANQTTALIGPSGAGKTTFADLLTGLLQPESGLILIDGQPLDRANLTAWGKQISYLPQDTFLFYGSIRENLTYLAPDATESDLWQALSLAAIDSVVRGLPEGLETIIGDQGMTLSGGERQRLAFARAILRKPTLLILDEATSALDGLNERHIQTTLNHLHGKVTIVLIAHRLATVCTADQIIILNNGEIRGCGNWQDVSKLDYVHDVLTEQPLH